MTAHPDEKDLNLKLRVMRYLWQLGYFVRRNVDLVGYERGRQYTDIDVLGVKIDENFNSDVVVCDCKSGIRVKTPERLFWLSGVMKYFDAPHGLFVRTKMISSKYIDLSSRLNIIPLSSTEIEQLEEAYNINSGYYVGSFCAEQNAADNVFSTLKQLDRGVHNYILKGYWKDLPQQQIVSLIASCRRTRQLMDLKGYHQSFILMYAISLLSLSILRFSQQILSVSSYERGEVIKQKLLGGNLTAEERKRILGGFYDFMTKEIEERYHEKYPISKGDFIDSLLPDYAKYFVDLVDRICQSPQSAIIAPRVLDMFAFDTVLNNRMFSLQEVLGRDLHGISLKPTKDFFTFAERSNLVTKSLSSTFHGMIKMVS